MSTTGIVFRHISSSVALAGKVKTATLLLQCVIHDEGLWNELLEKFKGGHTVYTSRDLQIAALEVLREALQREERKSAALERELKKKDEEISLLNRRVLEYDTLVSLFGSKLRT